MSKGNIVITNVEKMKSDNGFYTRNAVLVRFTNRGNSRVWIDEDEVLEPGEAFIEGDLNGPGIDHRYKLQFLSLGGSAPAADEPAIYADDRLHIRLFHRN